MSDIVSDILYLLYIYFQGVYAWDTLNTEITYGAGWTHIQDSLEEIDGYYRYNGDNEATISVSASAEPSTDIFDSLCCITFRYYMTEAPEEVKLQVFDNYFHRVLWSRDGYYGNQWREAQMDILVSRSEIQAGMVG